jgi:hypothetical protein
MKKYHSFGKSAIPALLVAIIIGATLGCSEATPDKPSLQSIAITSPPTKTVYTVGEALDISGIKVTGTYSGGTTKTETVSLSNISGYNKDATGEQTLTVTVGGKTATFTVTVNAPESNAVLQSIAITSPPTKTAYIRGDELDLSGLVVTGTYDDGTTKQETVGIADISGYDATAVGEQTLTVTVGGKTATFTVTVGEPPLGLDDLASAEGGEDAADPVSVALSDSFTNDIWASALSAIAEAGKYVSLDLSACAMTDTEFDPGAATEGADKITALVLPSTAKSIKAGTEDNSPFTAFTALQSISGAGIATIGEWAFYDCTSLTSVSLPAAETIGNEAFYECASLITVYLPVAETIGEVAFAVCTSLETVSLPAATTIGEWAFSDCYSLETVSLPAATDIGNEAFYECTSLIITDLPAAETIGRDAFRGCESLETVNLPMATYVAGFVSCTSLTSVRLPVATYVGGFGGCASLTAVSLPAATTIGNYAFSGCASLTEVSLPMAQTLGSAAFRGCTSLTTISLPAAQTIGNNAFTGCTSLTMVSLPAVETFSYDIFTDCTSLTTLSLPATPPPIENTLFYNTGSDGTITIRVPTVAVSAYTSAWGVDANTPENGNTSVYGESHKTVLITDAAQ